MITKNEFEVLRSLKCFGAISQRELSAKTKMSLGLVNKTVKLLREAGLITDSNTLTNKGEEIIKGFRVENAIILAAGMSTRFVPVSYEIPKGLTVVKGEVLIERQIRQLIEAGVNDIVVVVGHAMEKFFYLKEKYGVTLTVNNFYKVKNTHSSVYAAREQLKSTYICCSDNYYPQNLFSGYEYASMYCAQFLDGESRTERALITDKNGLIIATEKPCKDAYTMQGHAYFSKSFSKAFKKILEDYWDKEGTDGLYWEGIYAENLEKLPMYMVKYGPDDILEFDSVKDLKKFDPDYIINNDLQSFKNICRVLNIKPCDIKDIIPLQNGLTNKSFSFCVGDNKYVYRVPGKNTFGYVNRVREKNALTVAKELGIDDSYIFEDETEGWKLSHFIDETEGFDFENPRHLNKLCEHLKLLHSSKITIGSEFDFFKEADILIERLNGLNSLVASDMSVLRERLLPIYEAVAKDNWPKQLSHNDIYETNMLLSGDKLYLIDWEYAGDSDIGYDISKLFAVRNAAIDEIDGCLSYYFGRKPTADEKRHIIGCAAVNYYYWYVWAVYQSFCENDCNSWRMLWFEKMNKYADAYLRG